MSWRVASGVIETAKSNRSKCQGCRKPIEKGELRFGEEMRVDAGDQSMTRWYHLRCAASQKLEHFGTALAAYDGEVPDRAALEGSGASTGAANLLRVDRSPSSRASCIQCGDKIDKATLRVTVRVVSSDETIPDSTRYIHVACANAYAGEDVELATKASADDREETGAIGRAIRLLEEARGQELERAAQRAKNKKAELLVLGDWLEERGARLAAEELAQLVRIRKTK